MSAVDILKYKKTLDYTTLKKCHFANSPDVYRNLTPSPASVKKNYF